MTELSFTHTHTHTRTHAHCPPLLFSPFPHRRRRKRATKLFPPFEATNDSRRKVPFCIRVALTRRFSPYSAMQRGCVINPAAEAACERWSKGERKKERTNSSHRGVTAPLLLFLLPLPSALLPLPQRCTAALQPLQSSRPSHACGSAESALAHVLAQRRLQRPSRRRCSNSTPPPLRKQLPRSHSHCSRPPTATAALPLLSFRTRSKAAYLRRRKRERGEKKRGERKSGDIGDVAQGLSRCGGGRACGARAPPHGRR